MIPLRENIALLRRRRQLTQKELANMLGLRTSTVYGYETGYSAPGRETLIRMADIFGVRVDTLLGRSAPEEVPLEPPFQVVPIIGRITSADPVFPKEAVLGSLYLPQEAGKRQDYFAWAAADDSMDLCRIRMGDLLLIRRQSDFESGDIVLLISKGVACARRYLEEPTRTLLRPESTSSAYLPTPIEDAVLLGKVVRGIISF